MALPTDWRTSARFRAYNPARYIADLTVAGVAHRVNGSPPPIRVLLVSDNEAYTSEQQFAPLHRYRRELRRRFGMVLNHLLVSDVSALPIALQPYDLVIVKLSYKVKREQALDLIRRIARRKGAARLAYFDGDDDVCIQWPEVLEQVDLYVKKHMFSDLSQYQTIWRGKNNLTDYAAREFGASLKDHAVQASVPVEPRLMSKVRLGWNIGLDDKMVNLFTQAQSWAPQARTYDVICRANLHPAYFPYFFRKPVVEKLRAMASRIRVLTPEQAVPPDQYYAELRSAHVCVSPFGSGEVCWRDFEAIICKSLLLKPEMSHIATEPDIYRPGETYVPFRWDFSDLEEKCLYYLEHEDERQRIVERAYAELSEYYGSMRVLDKIGAMLTDLGLLAKNHGPAAWSSSAS